jgi:hypothetical protein
MGIFGIQTNLEVVEEHSVCRLGVVEEWFGSLRKHLRSMARYEPMVGQPMLEVVYQAGAVAQFDWTSGHFQARGLSVQTGPQDFRTAVVAAVEGESLFIIRTPRHLTLAM